MSFKKQVAALDLETTAIENLFLTDIMPMADGDALKVYLLGYRYASDPSNNHRMTHEILARHLGISISAVHSAWEFWASKGMVRKVQSPDTSEYSIEFISVRQLYIENNFEPKQVKRDVPAKPSVEQVAGSVQEQAFQKMFRDIESLLGRALYPNDCMDILEWVNELNLTPSDILKAFEYSVREKNAPNINYVAKVVRSWYAKGAGKTVPLSKPKQERPKNTNRFLNFEGQFSRLSDDELEKLIRNHQMKSSHSGRDDS